MQLGANKKIVSRFMSACRKMSCQQAYELGRLFRRKAMEKLPLGIVPTYDFLFPPAKLIRRNQAIQGKL